MPLSRLPPVFYGILRLVVAFLDMQPTLASQKPAFNQGTDSWISQVPPEDSSSLHKTPVSKQFPSPNLLRPLYCGHLRSNSSSPVNTAAVVSATEVDHNGRSIEVDLSTGITRGQHINTGFDDQSILPKADSKSDAKQPCFRKSLAKLRFYRLRSIGSLSKALRVRINCILNFHRNPTWCL